MDTSLKVQTMVFTGASRGMGRFAALELARRGEHILALGHNPERGAARRTLKQAGLAVPPTAGLATGGRPDIETIAKVRRYHVARSDRRV
jgi:NAD(P)-dependent dehydrogenase (short-subunit alcohol dehydrogenase family)